MVLGELERSCYVDVLAHLARTLAQFFTPPSARSAPNSPLAFERSRTAEAGSTLAVEHREIEARTDKSSDERLEGVTE